MGFVGNAAVKVVQDTLVGETTQHFHGLNDRVQLDKGQGDQFSCGLAVICMRAFFALRPVDGKNMKLCHRNLCGREIC